MEIISNLFDMSASGDVSVLGVKTGMNKHAARIMLESSLLEGWGMVLHEDTIYVSGSWECEIINIRYEIDSNDKIVEILILGHNVKDRFERYAIKEKYMRVFELCCQKKSICCHRERKQDGVNVYNTKNDKVLFYAKESEPSGMQICVKITNGLLRKNHLRKLRETRTFTILRWLAVLPAAVLASTCAFLLLTLLTVFQEISIISTIWESIANGEFILMVKPDSELSEFNVIGTVFITLNFICPAAASAAFVYAGAYTAPSGRKAVATVLATIKCMLPIIGITLAIISSTVDEYKWYEWLNFVAIVVGAIAAAIYIYGKEES